MKICYIAIGPFFGGPRSSLHSHKADANRAASKMRAQLRKGGGTPGLLRWYAWKNATYAICPMCGFQRASAGLLSCSAGTASWRIIGPSSPASRALHYAARAPAPDGRCAPGQWQAPALAFNPVT